MDVTNGWMPLALVAAAVYNKPGWFGIKSPKPGEFVAAWMSGVELESEKDLVHDKSKHHCMIGTVNPLFIPLGDKIIKKVHNITQQGMEPHKHIIPSLPLNVEKEEMILNFINELNYLPLDKVQMLVPIFLPYKDYKIDSVVVFHAPVVFYMKSEEEPEAENCKFIGQAHIAVKHK